MTDPSPESDTQVYKIVPRDVWREACKTGRYDGAPIDRADGFVHLSTGDQLAETAAKHFAKEDDLLVVAFNAADLADLRWEPSRGGALFPHLYTPLDPAAALWEEALTWDGDAPILPSQMKPAL